MSLVPQQHNFVMATVHGTSEEQIESLMSWFSSWMKYQHLIGRRGTVVFDIDDTLLRPNKHGTETRIVPVCRALHHCRRLGFSINLITARPFDNDNYRETVKTLRRIGIADDHYEGLYMMPSRKYRRSGTNRVLRDTVSEYKYAKRCEVARKHGDILANVGDMWWDHIYFPTMDPVFKTFTDDMAAILFPKDRFGGVSIKLPENNKSQ